MINNNNNIKYINKDCNTDLYELIKNSKLISSKISSIYNYNYDNNILNKKFVLFTNIIYVFNICICVLNICASFLNKLSIFHTIIVFFILFSIFNIPIIILLLLRNSNTTIYIDNNISNIKENI